jgi:Raf kinase inhibitor-like YbhB/YbcL family protein
VHDLRVTKWSPRVSVAILTGAAIFACGCGSSGGGTSSKPLPSAPARVKVTSSAFAGNGTIPRRYTCAGANVSPPLRWSGVPGGAAELALSVDDPDAPGGDFTHWLLYGIDPHATGIGEGASPTGAKAGKNSFGKLGYSGPCPPKGDKPHRYRFTLFALSRKLGLAPGASADEFRSRVGSAVSAEGTLVGRYSR